MRRLPLVASFLLFILLCAAVAYWAMQLFKPPLRPVAAPPRAAQAEARPEAAALLFGSRNRAVAAASNYRLHGVIFSGSARDSVAIISTDGKPAQAVRVDSEIVPGVTVTEVHRTHVMITEGGTAKRIELPEDAPASQVTMVNPALPPVQRTPTPPPAATTPPPTRAQTAASGGVPMQIGPAAGQPQVPPPPPPPPQAGGGAPQPGQAPMATTNTAPPSMGFSPPQGNGQAAVAEPPPPMAAPPGANPGQ